MATSTIKRPPNFQLPPTLESQLEQSRNNEKEQADMKKQDKCELDDNGDDDDGHHDEGEDEQDVMDEEATTDEMIIKNDNDDDEEKFVEIVQVPMPTPNVDTQQNKGLQSLAIAFFVGILSILVGKWLASALV